MNKQHLKEQLKYLEDPTVQKAQQAISLAFPNSKNQHKKNILGDINKAEDITNKTKIKVLSLYELKQEILNYDLVITPSKLFKGDYNHDYLKSINSFLEEHPTAISSDHELKYSMYVLYPNSIILNIFDKYSTGKFEQLKSGRTEVNNNAGYFIKNPTLLMYYNDSFYVIEKGSSYNAIDRIFGFLYKTKFRIGLTNLLLYLIIIMGLIQLNIHSIAIILLTVISLVILGVLTIGKSQFKDDIHKIKDVAE
jgi:hypothetical protein